MECFCERSVLAMTYPPSNLNEVMAELKVYCKECLCICKDVSKEAQTQNEIRTN